jgi:two-component system, cell cycle sensor histidine kinase and response regulator CckA
MLSDDPNLTEWKGLEQPMRPAQGQEASGQQVQDCEAHQAAGSAVKILKPRGEPETILLVDDEEQVRKLAAVVLGKHGYRVLQAATGEEALDVWKCHRTSISVLVTDMVMPGDLSGWELAQQLLDVQPRLGVIYTSGYTVEKAKEVFEITTEIIFIQKPYFGETLAAGVREVLEAAWKPNNPETK